MLPDRASFVFRAVRLRGIFDHDQSVPPGDFHDRVHVGGLTVKMHRQDRLRARRDRSLNRSGIHGERSGIDIDQHGLRSGIADRGDAGDKSKRDGDDFIAGTNARGEQGEMQRAGAGIQCDAFRGAAIGREFLFERSHFGAEYELATVQHVRDGRINLGLDALVLRFQIEIGNFNVCHECLRIEPLFSHQRGYAVASSGVRRKSTGRPCWAIDCDAACKISTTRRPALPAGHRFLLLLECSRRKWSISRRSASETSICGASMSPVR